MVSCAQVRRYVVYVYVGYVVGYVEVVQTAIVAFCAHPAQLLIRVTTPATHADNKITVGQKLRTFEGVKIMETKICLWNDDLVTFAQCAITSIRLHVGTKFFVPSPIISPDLRRFGFYIVQV